MVTDMNIQSIVRRKMCANSYWNYWVFSIDFWGFEIFPILYFLTDFLCSLKIT